MAASKLERLQEKKAKIKEQLAEIAKQESAVLAAEKERRRKADDHAKYLLAAAMIAEAKRNPAAMNALKMSLSNLNEKDRAAVAASALWRELAPAIPEAPKAAAAQEVPTCPKCGKPMRKRSGNRGEFWGCTGFPNCDGSRGL